MFEIIWSIHDYLRSSNRQNIINLTLEKVKVIAINSGQKGYSKLKKFDVIVFILNQSPLPKDSVRRKSVKQLKKIEKNRGIKNKY